MSRRPKRYNERTNGPVKFQIMQYAWDNSSIEHGGTSTLAYSGFDLGILLTSAFMRLVWGG